MMNKKDSPMIYGRKSSLPILYGDTPTLLGVDRVDFGLPAKGYDVLFCGVPWEGSVTWGSYSGCELAPRSIRHASARYGGFLPEYGIDLFDYLKLGDIGDMSVDPNSPKKTMEIVCEVATRIYNSGSVPFMFGGDHSYTPEVIRALGSSVTGKIGVIHFDAHFDNSKYYGEDEFPRCGPIHRIAGIESVRSQSIVHVGIRGPRNSKSQFEYAKEMGATIYDIGYIRKQGIEKVIQQSLEIAGTGTEHIYVTICSDCIDYAYNSGGPIDFDGLFPHELFYSLNRICQSGIAGLDFVEIYPTVDPRSSSSHLAVWAMIHALAGMAMKKAHDSATPHRPVGKRTRK